MIREVSLFAARCAIALALVGFGVNAVLAEEVEVRCAPVFVPDKRCENALKMRLERGAVPNRCKVA